MSRPKRATITDVANLAGVSRTTVSRALNTPETLAEETLKRVKEAQTKLNYAPSPTARLFRKGTAQQITLLVGDIRQLFIGELTKAICACAQEKNMTLTVVDLASKPDLLVKTLQDLTSDTCAGAIIATAIDIDTPQLREAVEKVSQRKIPIVITTQELPGSSTITACQNFTKNLQTAAQQLNDRGANNICLVTTDLSTDLIAHTYIKTANNLTLAKQQKPIEIIKEGTFTSFNSYAVHDQILQLKADGVIFTNLTHALATFPLLKNSSIQCICLEHASLVDLIAPELPTLKLDYETYALELIKIISNPSTFYNQSSATSFLNRK